MKISWISRRRAWRPSIKYSDSPDRKSRRVMVISPGLAFGLRGISWTLGESTVAVPFGASDAGSVGCSEPSAGAWAAARSGACCAIGSTKTMVTDAIPTGFRALVPAKITSSMRAPRRLRADCSPSTQLMASLRLDLPQPFGPTTAAIPPPLNFNSVLSQNDLKPWSSTFFNFSTAKTALSLPGEASP